MKNIDSDNDCNLNSSSCNGTEEVTDLLSGHNKEAVNLIKCNSDLVESYYVLKSTPMGHKNKFYQRVLSKNTDQDSHSRSMPSSLNNKLHGNGVEASNCDTKSKLLIEHDSPPLSPSQEMWFKTWPERYDKVKSDNTCEIQYNCSNTQLASSTCDKIVDISSVNNKVTLNEALQNISLAYSPITKQLHLLPHDHSNKSEINEKESKCIVDDHSSTKSKHKRTEAGSFSSTVSSLSDPSPSGSLLETEDRCACNDDSEFKTQKRGFSGFFNRNMFSWKSVNNANAKGWTLFSKNSEDAHTSPQHQNSQGIVASSSALIQHIRPSNLPAKTLEEDQRHREEYKAMVAAAKKKEAQTSAAKQKQQKQLIQQEEQLAAATKHFSQMVLPNWDSMCNCRKTRDLWWQGLPSSVRGKVWRLAIGNELNLTQQLYEICLQRAQNRLNNSDPSSYEVDSNVDQESSMDVIQLDISRTFPNLCIFQEGGPFSDVLHSLLAAYVCYRPDVGYVQGMSFIAAILILNMDELDAFTCFANLLNRPLHLAAFTLNQSQMQAYYNAYNEAFNYNMPKLYAHFQKSGLTPDLYLLDWIYTVFAKAMPLDVACRVWDLFLRDGDEFLFRTALGVLYLNQEQLMCTDFLHGAQFLTRLPDDLSSDKLFKCIQTVSTNVGKTTFGQIVERHKTSSAL